MWPRTRTCKINTELFKVCFFSCAGLFIHAHLGFDWSGVWMHVDMAAPAMVSNVVLTNCLDRSSLDHKNSFGPPKSLMFLWPWLSGLSILRTWFQPLWIQNFENHSCHDVKQVGERATGYGVSLLNSLFGTASKAALLQVIKMWLNYDPFDCLRDVCMLCLLAAMVDHSVYRCPDYF